MRRPEGDRDSRVPRERYGDAEHAAGDCEVGGGASPPVAPKRMLVVTRFACFADRKKLVSQPGYLTLISYGPPGAGIWCPMQLSFPHSAILLKSQLTFCQASGHVFGLTPCIGVRLVGPNSHF